MPRTSMKSIYIFEKTTKNTEAKPTYTGQIQQCNTANEERTLTGMQIFCPLPDGAESAGNRNTIGNFYSLFI